MSTVWDLHCALEFREGCWDWEGFREPPVDASTSEVLIGSRLLGWPGQGRYFHLNLK